MLFVATGAAVAFASSRLAPLVVTAASAWTADLTAYGLKQAFGRDRPFVGTPEPAPLDTAASLSFPSGHAALAFAGATALAAFTPRRAWVPLYLVAGAVAYSRVYIGVHYPADVVAGAVLGTATALLLLAAARRRSRRAPPRD